ncbi:MAG: YkvA family protein [Rhizobiaceae bacterium]
MDESTIEKILLPVPVEKTKAREKKVRAQFWSKMRAFAGRIPFSEDLAAAYFCATDNKTPLKVRGTLLAALAYFILPADLVPDFFVAVGFSDDLAVFTAAMTLVQAHVTDEHRDQAQLALQTEPEDLAS